MHQLSEQQSSEGLPERERGPSVLRPFANMVYPLEWVMFLNKLNST
jgi:hypothetical protein